MSYWIFTLSNRKKSIPDVHQPPRDPPHWSAEERVHTGGSYAEERRGAGCRCVHQQDVLVWSISRQDLQVIPNPGCSHIQRFPNLAALAGFHFHHPSFLVHPVTPSSVRACESVTPQGRVVSVVIKRWSRWPSHTRCVSMMGGRQKLSGFSAEPHVLFNFAVSIITTISPPYTHICTLSHTHPYFHNSIFVRTFTDLIHCPNWL